MRSKPLNITVLGGTGKIGRLVVATLLDAGHHVIAYARDPAKLDIVDPNLSIVQGTLDDAARWMTRRRSADRYVAATA